MNRRTLLGALGVATIGLAGCLGSSSDPEPEENESDDDGCRPIGALRVFISASIPEDASTVDADELTENEYIEQALEEGDEAYEDGMEDEFEDDDDEELLTRVTGSSVAASDILDYIEYGEDTYVEYEGVTYTLLYEAAQC